MKKLLQRLTILSVIVLAGCSSKTSHQFPEPKAMKPMVSFWEKVYSEWSENQAVYHDNRYLDVIYEIKDVPSANRRSVLNSHESVLRERLTNMVNSYQTKQALTSEQKKWIAMLKKAGGEKAIYEAPERLRYQTGLKNNFRRGLEISGYYMPEFKQIMKKNNVPTEIAYLPHVESSFQGHAYSSVGASGMWQFMPATARGYLPMQRNVIDGRLDPFMAAQGAAAYLREAHDRVGEWPLALTGYNHGVGGMVRAKNEVSPDIGRIVWEYQGPRFGFASRNFYAEFLAAKKIAENGSSYFPDLVHKARRKVDGIILVEPIKVRDLASSLMVSEMTLIELNPAWLQNVRLNKVAIPANIPIWLPKGSAKKLPTNVGRRIEKR